MLAKTHPCIFQNGEAVALCDLEAAPAQRLEPHPGLGPCDEEGLGGGDLDPPAVMAIGLVEHVGGTLLDGHRATDLGVVDVGIGDVEDARAIELRIVDDMQLHATDAAIRFGPIAQLAERNGGRVDQPQHCRALAPQLTLELARKQAESLGKDGKGPPPARIRQRRTPQQAAAEMVVVLAVGVPAGFQAAQAVGTAELGEDQHHQMIPARERLVVGVSAVAIHSRLETAPIDRFNQLAKNARPKAHAPFLF